MEAYLGKEHRNEHDLNEHGGSTNNRGIDRNEPCKGAFDLRLNKAKHNAASYSKKATNARYFEREQRSLDELR